MIINNNILEINLNNSSSYILNLLYEVFKDKEPMTYIDVRIMIGGTKVASAHISEYDIALEYVNRHISLYKSYIGDILNKVQVPAKQIITPMHAIESIDDLNIVIAYVNQKDCCEHEIYLVLSHNNNENMYYKENTENILKVLDFMKTVYAKSEKLFNITWSPSPEFVFDYTEESNSAYKTDTVFSTVYDTISKIIINRTFIDDSISIQISPNKPSYLYQIPLYIKFYSTDMCIDWLINSHIKYLQFKQDMIKSAKDKGIYDIPIIQNFIARGLN